MLRYTGLLSLTSIPVVGTNGSVGSPSAKTEIENDNAIAIVTNKIVNDLKSFDFMFPPMLFLNT